MANEEVTEVAEAVSEAAGVIERGVEAVASQIAELAATYGEPAWNTVLLITQISAAQSIVTGLVLAAIAGACVWWLIVPFGKKLHAAIVAEAPDHRAEMARMDARFGNGVALGVSSFACVFPAVGASTKLFSVWNWIALFSPELYLAKRALDAVVGL